MTRPRKFPKPLAQDLPAPQRLKEVGKSMSWSERQHLYMTWLEEQQRLRQAKLARWFAKLPKA